MSVEIECVHDNRGEARRCPTTQTELKSFAKWWHESPEATVHILAQLRTWEHLDWYCETYSEFGEVCCGGWYSEEDFSAHFEISWLNDESPDLFVD